MYDSAQPMPFGKFEGVAIGDLPKQYVQWIVKQKWLQPPLKDQLEEALAASSAEHTVERLLNQGTIDQHGANAARAVLRELGLIETE